MAYLTEAWSATRFPCAEMSAYADKLICNETRHGVQIMALAALMIQMCVPVLVLQMGLSPMHVYTFLIIGALSLHVLISAHFLSDLRALQALGMVLLIMSALAITFLAHRTGALSIGMMAATVMLFVAIPLVPWGLREAATIIVLTVLLLTSSLVSVPGRFNPNTLWTLQILMVGASFIVIVVVARNAYIRKQNIRARFELEKAREAMEMLSMKDHLTGAWNRRYLDAHFLSIATHCRSKGKKLEIAILDIDDFKVLNDSYGHDRADHILASLGEVFVRNLGERGYLVRLGGDEFQILYCGDGLRELIDASIEELRASLISNDTDNPPHLTISAGFASTAAGERADQEKLYKQADKALYVAKQQKSTQRFPVLQKEPDFDSTQTWKI